MPRASSLEQELRSRLGPEIDVRLIPGSGGVFEVSLDGQRIFSKSQAKRFPAADEIVQLVLKAGAAP
ncbi:MAG: hypothetical protein BWK76_01730 [Desulfobulbaceae bacterium A2]|nr:MAG: hypothetical protein BWK76_01730 [Desulfobulbaceae bacterium A2]